jgi:hypothetical protein
MEDLDLAEMAQQLLAAVRKLPPGQKRQNALKELGCYEAGCASWLKELLSRVERSPAPLS